MKVKTYRAGTLKAALEQIKQELGSDAFILSQKEIRPRTPLDILKGIHVELTAAIDYVPPKPETPAPSVNAMDAVRDRVRLSNPSVKAARPLQATGLGPAAGYRSEPKAEPKAERRPEVKPAPIPEPPPVSSENHVLVDEIRRLKAMVQSISDRPRNTIWLKPHRFSSSTAEQTYLNLIERGIEDDLAYDAVSAADGLPGTSDDLRQRVTAVLSERIQIDADLVSGVSTGRPEIVALFGPTGVGKTTTLAKIAARAALQDRLKVGLVTLDTFRIAAIEQLKTYGEIMGVSVRVVENVRHMDLAIQGFSDRDLILIDTAGRSQRDVANDWELADYMLESTRIRKTLVLSATTKPQDLADIVDRYEIFGARSLIFTKFDETVVYGPVINELVRSGKPLAYVTIGQGVPQDIVKPEVSQLIELATGSKHSENWKAFVNLTRPTEHRTNLEATFN